MLKKYSEKLLGSRIGSKRSHLTKKTLNKVFLVKKVLIKGKAQKSIPSGEIHWKYILKRYMTDSIRNDEMLLDSPAEAMMIS